MFILTEHLNRYAGGWKISLSLSLIVTLAFKENKLFETENKDEKFIKVLAIVQIWTFLFSSFLKINAQALKYFCSSSSVNDNIFYRHYKNKRNSSIICFLFKLYKLLIDDNTTI